MASDGIHVTRWGNSGPEVLLIHGGVQGTPTGGEHQWSAQRPLADQGFRLVVPDRPGHGRTPTRGREDFELDAQWVAEMLGEGAHLVGHSYGGVIALCAAGLRPSAVKSLTVIEAPIFSVALERQETQALIAELAGVAGTKNRLRAVHRMGKVLAIEPQLMRDMGPRPKPRDLWRMATEARRLRPPLPSDEAGAVSVVAKARIPVLAVDGGANPGFDAVAAGLVEKVGAEHLKIKAGHHFPQLAGNPPGAEFNAALAAFLKANPGRRGRR